MDQSAKVAIEHPPFVRIEKLLENVASQAQNVTGLTHELSNTIVGHTNAPPREAQPPRPEGASLAERLSRVLERTLLDLSEAEANLRGLHMDFGVKELRQAPEVGRTGMGR